MTGGSTRCFQRTFLRVLQSSARCEPRSVTPRATIIDVGGSISAFVFHRSPPVHRLGRVGLNTLPMALRKRSPPTTPIAVGASPVIRVGRHEQLQFILKIGFPAGVHGIAQRTAGGPEWICAIGDSERIVARGAPEDCEVSRETGSLLVTRSSTHGRRQEAERSSLALLDYEDWTEVAVEAAKPGAWCWVVRSPTPP